MLPVSTLHSIPVGRALSESIKNNNFRMPPMVTPVSFLFWIRRSWKATLLGQRKIDALSIPVTNFYGEDSGELNNDP